jgi:hypothetical protein
MRAVSWTRMVGRWARPMVPYYVPGTHPVRARRVWNLLRERWEGALSRWMFGGFVRPTSGCNFGFSGLDTASLG